MTNRKLTPDEIVAASALRKLGMSETAAIAAARDASGSATPTDPMAEAFDNAVNVTDDNRAEHRAAAAEAFARDVAAALGGHLDLTVPSDLETPGGNTP